MSILIKGWYEEPSLFYIYNKQKEMYTLGIPKRDYRRATQVLGYESQPQIPFEADLKDDGFYIFSFPGADEYDFKEIISLLKLNGINAIGADTALDTAYELNERKIMKLKNLLEQNKKSNRMESAEDVIEKVDEIITDNPDTALDLLSDMVEDFYENQSIDRPDVSLQEIKLKKLIKILVKEWHEQD